MWGLCMPNFKPLAALVWEEEEVTRGRTDVTPFWPSHNEIFTSSLTLFGRSGGIKWNFLVNGLILSRMILAKLATIVLVVLAIVSWCVWRFCKKKSPKGAEKGSKGDDENAIVDNEEAQAEEVAYKQAVVTLHFQI